MDEFVSLQQFALRARRNLTRPVWDYLMGGSETETNWFVTNRIQIMEELNLVQCKNEALTLLPKGVFAGKMGIIVKKVLNMGVGG